MSNSKESEYRLYIATKLQESSIEISDLWLASLGNVVNEDARDIFPTQEFLDHIPELIKEIGVTLKTDDQALALVNSLIDRKAEQLGTLRHKQKATVNQLLREYDLLSKILEEFVIKQTEYFSKQAAPQEYIEIMASIAQIVRSILQSTVDAFVGNYMATIEQQTEKIQSFNTFVSHELKTPLQAASLNIELLLEDRDILNEDARQLVRVQSSIQQAAALLKNIERLFRNTDLVTDTPAVQELELSTLLSDIVEQLEETLSDRKVTIHICDSLGTVAADTAKLRLVFTNLVTNAIKYRDPEKESCDIWIERQDQKSNGMYGVVVRDNGLGIDESMQKDVFKMRFRAHESYDKELANTGHGLGLYLVKESLQDLNGEISLTSAAGEGARFLVFLPGIVRK